MKRAREIVMNRHVKKKKQILIDFRKLLINTLKIYNLRDLELAPTEKQPTNV